MDLTSYEHFELHIVKPRAICVYENYEVLEDKDQTLHFYSKNPLFPVCSLYIPSSEIKIERILDKTDRLVSNKNYQLLARK